jgi:WD40 repeat protein
MFVHFTILTFTCKSIRFDKLFVLIFLTGHNKAVRDICFNNDGSQFLTAAYDRYCKLWDTETGRNLACSPPLLSSPESVCRHVGTISQSEGKLRSHSDLVVKLHSKEVLETRCSCFEKFHGIMSVKQNTCSHIAH